MQDPLIEWASLNDLHDFGTRLERSMPRTVTSLIQPPHVALPRAWLRFADLADLVDLVSTWADVARQRRRLAAMDNRLLSDIGFSHADVDREINRPFWDIEPGGR